MVKIEMWALMNVLWERMSSCLLKFIKMMMYEAKNLNSQNNKTIQRGVSSIVIPFDVSPCEVISNAKPCCNGGSKVSPQRVDFSSHCCQFRMTWVSSQFLWATK